VVVFSTMFNAIMWLFFHQNGFTFTLSFVVERTAW